MNKEVHDNVICFISEHLAVKVAKLSLDTTLEGDLGVDGDDAYELMVEFGNNFNVDMSEFDFGKHFGPEAGFNPLIYAFYCIFKRKRLKLESITISDLIRAAENGEWEPALSQN